MGARGIWWYRNVIRAFREHMASGHCAIQQVNCNGIFMKYSWKIYITFYPNKERNLFATIHGENREIYLINWKGMRHYMQKLYANFLLIFSCLLLQCRWKLRSNVNDEGHSEIYWRGILETASYLQVILWD